MTCIVFNQTVKHGTREFAPGVPYDVAPAAASYFITAGWADESSETPVITVAADEIDIDPSTVWGTGEARGQRVLG